MTDPAGAVEPQGGEGELRAADGRVPGRRGLATRQKLLACAADMLRASSYRDLKVVDIAREAGTSPATFYQYFPDVESAVLALADEMVTSGVHRFAEIVTGGAWKGKPGYAAAEELADAFLAFWDEHSLNAQRYYNIACWVFGANPDRHDYIVKDGHLPEARAERCPNEFAQMQKSWSKLLGPHMKGE